MFKVEPTLENLASHIQRQDRSLKAMSWSVLGATILAAAAIISSQWHATANADTVKAKPCLWKQLPYEMAPAKSSP